MIVVDASVVVDYLLGAGSATGDVLATRMASGEHLVAPQLLDVEVAQVLRRFALRGEVDSDVATQLVGELLELPIRRYPLGALVVRAFELRDNVTAYDGTYLLLAELLDAPLLTADAGLAAVPSCRATVEVVSAG